MLELLLYRTKQDKQLQNIRQVAACKERQLPTGNGTLFDGLLSGWHDRTLREQEAWVPGKESTNNICTRQIQKLGGICRLQLLP